MALTTTQTSPAQQTAATPASPEGEKPAQGQAHAAAPVRLMTCPCCKHAVKVFDPYAGRPAAEQRASAWFEKHDHPLTGKPCIGSHATAIDREPRPTSEDGIDTELEEGLVDLDQIVK